MHDLRTPLGVIRGFACNLLDEVYGPVEGSQRDAVERVQGACDILRGLVDQVRSDLPAPPELDDDLRPQRIVGRTQVSLEELGDEVAEFLGSAAAAGGATLALEKERCPLIWGNRVRLLQALVNLVKNATRFTPSGGRITLGVEPVPPTDDHPWARCGVTVSDTGAGIEPALQEKIFEAGFSTGKGEGHQGMGLAVVSEVVKEHGGSLELRSTPGAGTSFRLLLPVDPRRRRRRSKVRIVRDAAFAAEALAELRRAGAEITEYAAPAELEELARMVRGGGQELLLVEPVTDTGDAEKE